ncbi:MAG: dTDP-4-dehydrorhamnose 3,5-epimerase family protein, partial [Bdellovibrionales bacterium]|nr:dTDP-4-dehydrorhamnose 3,5-epimerase family protein [Bdellovibrionales bacterium]
TFHKSSFRKHAIDLNFEESFYSRSLRGVIRGMHFQVPPMQHAKLIYVTEGDILDVAIDLRRSSASYGRFFAIELSAENHKAVLVPCGFAHGFLTKSPFANVVYLQSSEHSPEHDLGIRWDSFGFNWGIESPLLSDRDRNFPSLESFESPFV